MNPQAEQAESPVGRAGLAPSADGQRLEPATYPEDHEEEYSDVQNGSNEERPQHLVFCRLRVGVVDVVVEAGILPVVPLHRRPYCGLEWRCHNAELYGPHRKQEC